jgi:hypothetical protein
MERTMSPAVPAKPILKLIGWRTVAACGLPVWAFLLGMLLSPRPAWLANAAPAGGGNEDTGVAIAPMPREIVIRHAGPEVVTMPLVVPVPVPTEPIGFVAAGADDRLPASELLPADRCKSYDTKLRFHPTLADAADEARKARKMLFVLHISGDFEDPGFT